jgi:anion-transporting  ArsA/GET3 family ATPase
MSTPVARLLRDKRVIVCCGAGGVGKTTVSASLALAAARMGRRVLVVTIDPSRRLAETLGVDRNPTEPVAISSDRLEQAGVTGTLEAWMLDPQLVSDNVVRSFSRTEDEANRLLNNSIYRNVTAMVAGMQEYTAVEALYQFVQQDRYDLVILDTPPSRDALRFLDAPVRANAFLDRRIFNLFTAGEGGMIRRLATRLVERVMDTAFGHDLRVELQQFFELFGALLGNLNHNQTEMKAFFRSADVGFLLITSPAKQAQEEAGFFAHKAGTELGMEVCGYILNRSYAALADRSMPSLEAVDPAIASEAVAKAIEKLMPMAEEERLLVGAHQTVAEELTAKLPANGFVWVLPFLGQDASYLDGLVQLACALTELKESQQSAAPVVGANQTEESTKG